MMIIFTASHLALTKELSTNLKEKRHPSMSEQTLSSGRVWSAQRRNALVTAKTVEIGPLMKRKLSLPPINPK